MTQPNEQKEKWILASVPNELFDEAKQIYYNAPSSSMRFFGHDPLELLESQLQQTREELELKESEYQSSLAKITRAEQWAKNAMAELEQVKTDRDNIKKKWHHSNSIITKRDDEVVSLRTELAAKDKVQERMMGEIEALRKYIGRHAAGGSIDARQLLCEFTEAYPILSQYKGEAKG